MLARVTKRADVARAVRSIHDRFRKGGKAIRTTIGFPGGSVEETAYWRADAGVWLALHSDWSVTRHWSAYGVVTPTSDTAVPIAVEINPPIEGVNRQVAGFIASDGTHTYLCHTGRVGGGREGINQRAFIAWRGDSRVEVADGDGRSTSAFIVGCVDSEEFMAQIADFVKLVAQFKARESPLATSVDQTSTFTPEFAGAKSLPASEATIAFVNHGVIVNRMAEELRAFGITPGRTQTRDLFIGSAKFPSVHFEVKASCDTQSIYTAVGQLCLLNVGTPGTKRVLVAPTPHPQQLKSALATLGICLLGYEWQGQRPAFPGLADLVADLKLDPRK